MHQFALFAGIIITALILNTLGFLMSVLLLNALPDGVTGSVTAYAGILIALNLVVWLLLLGGGSAILHQERTGHSPMALKLGIMLTTLFLLTVVFILSCILLSVFQNDLQTSLVTSRNYTVAVLILTFVTWVLLLAGSALLAQAPQVKHMADIVEMETPAMEVRPTAVFGQPMRSPMRSPMSPMRSPDTRNYMYGMTKGRAYGMTCGANY